MAKLLLFGWQILWLCYGVSTLDFFIFALQYPVGYCKVTVKNRCREHNMREHFTIHGLWPGSTAPHAKTENCHPYEHFNVEDLTPIRTRLEEIWPSMKSHNPAQFWAHEWKKHGTCGVSVPGLTGFLSFFNTTLALYERFNLTQFLENDDILPSAATSYAVADVQHALKNDLYSKVDLVCDQANSFEYPVLTEVHLCLNLDLQPIDCPYKKERCGKDRMFLLPLKDDDRVPGTISGAQDSPYRKKSMSDFSTFGAHIIVAILAALHITRPRVLP
ncbi:ribonuclease Oy-like isoform X1 [Varroa destructor]|uniref:Uncharacterized protein n=1 Tax=Varroa destructor TaxID=109461 RepID=A0A7M7KJ43_VARDE|nr:ribonuclease Oy-like isoform X1 [Varroa destructor]XP_022667605.1 ribonuclease Oy-like isoform X1 [Varroa destructor]XP_022667606.1 ribonuclease Oy-like isoform X1 [Varroa destructor]XP_022667607.1 ribonuclease Oy-like isoform X1 [Varroa destructor]XP_022667608.1 ribonuclease Oy-like isoform X1 [Varroa destructor]XP_022667609.1 ribonuclease Oy-like isoform X1 [Varroa destructor]XP_022667610.1 ribonuclease Oy-like isoform X1 [Varroa destructor]